MPWNCDSCHTNVKNDLVCTRCGSAAPGADPHLVGLALQRDRIMEGHLSALAVWNRVFGVLGVLGGFALLVGGARMLGPLGDSPLAASLTVSSIFLVLLSAFAFLLGHFLARWANWARITGGVFAAIALAWQLLTFAIGLFVALNTPTDMYGYSRGPSLFWVIAQGLFGVVWSASVTWAYLSPRSAHVCSEPYRHIAAQTSSLRPSTFRSFFFMVPLLLVGGFVVWTGGMYLLARF